MGSSDLVGLGWLSSGFQEPSQSSTLQQEGEGSGFVPEHRTMQKNQALRVGCRSVFLLCHTALTGVFKHYLVAEEHKQCFFKGKNF